MWHCPKSGIFLRRNWFMSRRIVARDEINTLSPEASFSVLNKRRLAFAGASSLKAHLIKSSNHGLS